MVQLERVDRNGEIFGVKVRIRVVTTSGAGTGWCGAMADGSPSLRV
jgi:hypothetical protein